VIPYRLFWTAYLSHLQQSRHPRRRFFTRVTLLRHIRCAQGLVPDFGAIPVISTKGTKPIHREDWQCYALQTFPKLFEEFVIFPSGRFERSKFYFCFRKINIVCDHILNCYAWNKYTQELYFHVFNSVTVQAHGYDSLGRLQRVQSRR
jgi:hypothetical protein